MMQYWVICRSYEYEGKEIQTGSMHQHHSTRPIISNNWRRATDEEIKGMQWHKGKYYYHKEATNERC